VATFFNPTTNGKGVLDQGGQGSKTDGQTMKNPDELASLARAAVESAFSVALRMVEKDEVFCIYGAGDVGELLFYFCRERGLKPTAFLDDLSERESFCGIPVCGVVSGIDRFRPASVLLGTIKATERMKNNLATLNYSGSVYTVRDAHAHFRPPHQHYEITPREEIQVFCNRHAGQRAFVIGNGPSLLKTDPRRLMARNEITFAANNVFLLEGFKPTYYTAIDRVLTMDRANEINALPWMKFFPHLVSPWITNGFFLHAHHSDWPEQFSDDISLRLEIDFTVTYSMLQIALYMGCSPVYLIGVDHTYAVTSEQCHQDGCILTSVSSDPNHFHPGYFGKGYRWSKPRMEPLEACYRVARDAYKAHGRELYNATCGGALEVLPRVSFEELLT